MRLFTGIALSSEAAAALAAVRNLLAAAEDTLRWSQPQSWHVTLQFLGSADATQAACVTRRLGAVRAQPVPVRIAGLDFFDRAGVFFAGVAMNPQLLALEQKVKAATRACGFVPEARPWNPHITLARAKGRDGPAALAPLKKQLQRLTLNLAAEFDAGEFLLYESFPGPEGSRYEVRARFPLAS